MNRARVDELVRTLFTLTSRRAALRLGGWSACAGLAGPSGPNAAVAKRKKRKGKKFTLCHDGQTIRVSKKKKKKHLQHGDTRGPCSGPPPPTPSCSPSCNTGDVCVDGDCRPCNVTCDGNGAACGAALQAALDGGHEVRVCPGRYIGNFRISGQVDVYGAGQGSDPATNTVLDADGDGRVLDIDAEVEVHLTGLHLTGGRVEGAELGGGLRNVGSTTMNSCTVRQNSAVLGGGIDNRGPLTLNDCSVRDNVAVESGGGIFQLTASLVLNNSTVAANEAELISGGGIMSGFASVVVSIGSDITGNRANMVGGGIANTNVVMLDDASRVNGNTAGDEGGGIYNEPIFPEAFVVLNGATVSGNSTPQCVDVEGC